jgi:tripartite-type tricarboxylate transporter receptor subunit TctC
MWTVPWRSGEIGALNPRAFNLARTQRRRVFIEPNLRAGSSSLDRLTARWISDHARRAKTSHTRFRFVPYRGGAQAMRDLVAGQIDLMITDQVTSLPQVRGGNIRAYAVAGQSRLAVAPDLPTVDQTGFPGFYCSVWTALFAPKATPKAIIDKLNAAAVTALAEPAVRQQAAELGQQIVPPEQQTPEVLAALQKAEIEKWWPIIKAAGIRAE